MSAARDHITTILLVYSQLSLSAMVLPRPPSSPNHIQQDPGLSGRKVYEGKSLQGYLQSTNVEKPSLNDYSLLEIELQSPDEVDASNLRNIVDVMLKHSEHVRNDSYPHPEVIPHSIFGVRDVGLVPNFKLNPFQEEKHVLLNPLKLRNLDEKLYYLKNNRPKVYVNVRGRSGSYQKDSSFKTTSSNDPVGYLRVTPAVQRQTDSKLQHSKKTRPPKKFDRLLDGADTSFENENDGSRKQSKTVSRLASVYGADNLSTTENSMVTSSELPKQIPAPPSKMPSRTLMAQTTPVQRHVLRRTDILPGYSFSDV